MNIYKSSEDYLEAILALKERNGAVRSIDIVNELGYSKPSISIAMKKLRENGYIEMDQTGYITLTDAGREIAEKIYTRHRVLTKLLEYLGVDSKIAEEDACKVEHDLSEETFMQLKKIYCKKVMAGDTFKIEE